MSIQIKPFVIKSLSFHESVIMPAFADVLPQGFPYQGTLNEFTLMNDVKSSKPIVDIRRQKNILQRRDASCDLIYKKVFGASTRKVTVEEVYGATKFCKNEFYQGALKDWEGNDPIFGENILPYFQQAVNTDIASNSYFGDVDRVVDADDEWSTDKFDGIFKWIGKYITSTIIPASQSFAIADDADYLASAASAYNLLKTMYNAQPDLMGVWMDDQKAFYVSKDIASGYEDYLIATGATNGNIQYLQDGIKKLYYKGIPVLVEPIWAPIIYELKGSKGHAAILTIRGNFIFATDKDYGEGPKGDQALRVFYSDVDLQWFYQLFLRAGTQIALPEFIIVAMSEW